MDPFEQIRRNERERCAEFVRRKGLEARELLLRRTNRPADWAVAELAAGTIARLCDVIADMVKLGVMP